ncbi:sensor histidine kinase [uncultured Chitinophaga sp.]|uniref:sensor histidine kinase n=1 Tax=uncultured Chitinophaga sp. TaxID=339340 RepID=UPI0025CE462E|nr:sensor histidine kinase [uncultured Chitinophaga sp.]
MKPIKHIFRNKLVVVVLHIIAWLCFFMFPFFAYRIQVSDYSFFYKEIVNTLVLIGLFYLNMYVLIPRFFTLKKISLYIASVLLLIVVITLQQAIIEYQFMGDMMKRPHIGLAIASSDGRRVVYRTQGGPDEVMHTRFDEFDTSRRVRHFESRRAMRVRGMSDSAILARPFPPEDNVFRDFIIPQVLRRTVMFTLLMLFMSGFIKIGIEWFKSEKQREALKVANLNAELKFLKNQINPHFLFNCLNTIYSLAHKKSPETEHALVKLSTILRYMIYQANEDKVLLANELRYLHDYIDIQKLRLPKSITVDYTVAGDAGTLQIAPMLLIPFVENAFKHGISYSEEAYIIIQLVINNGSLNMLVRNKIIRQKPDEAGGVGLTNALKRLDMMYAGAHEITVKENGNEFIADLKIVLNHDEVYRS